MHLVKHHGPPKSTTSCAAPAEHSFYLRSSLKLGGIQQWPPGAMKQYLECTSKERQNFAALAMKECHECQDFPAVGGSLTNAGALSEQVLE